MKVLFDHQLFSWQKYGGASKYFAELMAHLPREMWDCTVILSNNAYLEELKIIKYKHFLPSLFFKGQGRLMHELNKPYSAYKLWRKDFDIYHQMHFDPYGIKYIGSKPLVTTFHDTNFSTYHPNPHEVKRQRKSVGRADKVIAVSHNTKKDLVNLFDVPPEKVEVIYHGIEKNEIPDDAPLYDFPYILYVGFRQNHKNFDRLLLAFQKYSKLFPEVRLLCTWKQFSAEEMERIGQLGLTDRVVHRSASELEMKLLYRDALFFIFPSLYEGFGMPILEAMSLDCPTVISDASCFPEIAGDATLYFDPRDVDSMVGSMVKMTEDSELRNRIIDMGRERVKDFSWEKCANQHLDVYRSLL